MPFRFVRYAQKRARFPAGNRDAARGFRFRNAACAGRFSYFRLALSPAGCFTEAPRGKAGSEKEPCSLYSKGLQGTVALPLNGCLAFPAFAELANGK